MRIKEGFKIRTMLGENIVTGEGAAQINFNKIISLNESAAFLWRSVEGKDFDAESLAGLLVEEYGIERELALNDARAIAQKWLGIGIVEE